MMSFLHSPATEVGRRADSITDYFQRHRAKFSVKFSDNWVHKNQDNWSKIKEQLKLIRETERR